DVLRPEGVTDATLRQGEFFFVPVNKEEALMLATIDRTHIYVKNSIDYYDEKDHIGDVVAFDHKIETTYVIGAVTNPRHDDVYLHGWHRVVVNNELPMPENLEGAIWD